MSKLSKSSSSIRKKWEDVAIAKGGKDAKIIISQSEVQPLVFNLLRDSFRPMNITTIYETLQAVVPPPVLKTCLETISAGNQSQGCDNDNNDDDDDDDDFVTKKKKKKSKDKSVNNASGKDALTKPSDQQKIISAIDSDAVKVKNGRNTNTTLYYCNQLKLINDGNGLKSEDHHQLVAAKQELSAKLETLSKSTKSLQEETTILLSQPTNDKLDELISKKESELSSLQAEINTAKSYAGNKDSVSIIKRKIAFMASEWRKRKRQCVDFLDMIEDSTEGVISKKKCLAGNGQIELESDEVSLKQARETFNNQQSRITSKSRVIRRHIGAKEKEGNNPDAGSDKVQASPSFIGVKLGTSLTSNIVRVYAEK